MKMMKRHIFPPLLLLVLFFCIPASFACLAGVPERPEPQRLVNDLAGIFNSGQTFSLEQRLVAFDDSTSNQITVVTVSDLEGYEPAEMAVRIGLDWGVGSKDFNNGIVILVKPKTTSSSGAVSIQVGYGLEGAIPDSYCKRIIEQEMIPHFREEDYFGGVSAAVDVLMALASGEIFEPRGNDEDDLAEALLALAFIMVVMIILVIALRGKGGGGGNRSSRDPDPYIFFGPISGRPGGSFGGFSGGGFSGGGFGGFGGGSFGGGGASGRW